MTNPEEIKGKFYEDIENAIEGVPKEDKLILLGDFNARVGRDHQTWEGIIGRNGDRPATLEDPCITRPPDHHTVYRQPNRNKTSWMHPLQTLARDRLYYCQKKRQT